jgi:hypothetical protein
MFERPSRAAFEGQLGQEIRVSFDDGTTLALRIAEVVDHSVRKTRDGTVDAYAVYFHGPLDITLPQSTYLFTSDALGERAIFIVPLGPTGDVMVYEAIFN